MVVDIWEIAKYFAILGFTIYFVFALVVVRQIELMTKTLEVGFETPIKILGILHLIFALIVLFLAFILL